MNPTSDGITPPRPLPWLRHTGRAGVCDPQGECCRTWLGVGAHRDAPLQKITN